MKGEARNDCPTIGRSFSEQDISMENQSAIETVAGPARGLGSRFDIGSWSVDRELNELRRGAEVCRLEPKAIEVLAHLAQNAGRVVSREDLLEGAWPQVVVTDDALTQVVTKLRKALGDDAHDPRYIETISKRGYRLVAHVSVPLAGEIRAPAPRWRVVLLGGAAAVGLAGIAFLLHGPAMPWPIGEDVRGGSGVSFPLVAVLPLSNLGGDPNHDYFSDGVTEDLTEALGRFSGLRVVSHNTARAYRDRRLAAKALRNELGVRYVVQGSIREAEGRLRVAVELSDAERGIQLWSDHYDGQATGLFEMQDRAVRRIAGTLAAKLDRSEEQRVVAKPSEALEAYDLLLRARFLIRRQQRAANREARELLARAGKLAPDSAEILTARCDAEFKRAMFGWVEDRTDSARRAIDLCNQALATPDTRAHTRAHAVLSGIFSNQNRFKEALEHAESAIELNASDSAALYRRGISLLYMGRIDEGIAAMENARRFEPQAYEAFNLAVAYCVSARYEEALAQADALLAAMPDDASLLSIRAAALAQLGKMDEAREAVDRLRRARPDIDAQYFGTRFADPKYTARLQEAARKAGL